MHGIGGRFRKSSGAANPIGLSKSRHGTENGSVWGREDAALRRSSSASRAGRAAAGDGGDNTANNSARSGGRTRSTSLADGSSFFSGTNSGDVGNRLGGNNATSLSRANSFASQCSAGSEIHEPSWFSHAFDAGGIGGSRHCAETLRLAARVVGVKGGVPVYVDVNVDDNVDHLGGMEVDVDVGMEDARGGGCGGGGMVNEVDTSEVDTGDAMDAMAVTRPLTVEVGESTTMAGDVGEGGDDGINAGSESGRSGTGSGNNGNGQRDDDDGDDDENGNGDRNRSKARMIDMMKRNAKSRSFHGGGGIDIQTSGRGRTVDGCNTNANGSTRRASGSGSIHGGGGDNVGMVIGVRRSRSQTRRASRGADDDHDDVDDDDEAMYSRVRERSLSIVRDARSFIDSIDVDCGGEVANNDASGGGIDIAKSREEREIEGWRGKVEEMEARRIADGILHEREIMEWKDKVDHMEARLATIGQTYESEIDGWRSRTERLECKCVEMEREIERRDMAIMEREGARSEAERDLREALLKLSDLESRDAFERSRLRSDYDCMVLVADEWKEKYYTMEMQHRELLDENDKCQRSIVTESTNKSDGSSSASCAYNSSTSMSSSTSAVNDELVDRIGDLADENCRLSSRCRELENELHRASCRAENLDGLVQRIEILEDEKLSLTSRCVELEQELNKASTRTQSLGELVEQIGELGDENARLSSKCQELECELQGASVATTQHVQDITRDLESSMRNNAEAHDTIETLRMENRHLCTKARELMRELRRCSSLFTSRSKCADENEDDVVAQAEDDASHHESMEGAIRLTSEIWKKLATFVEMYETNVNEYNAKFSALNENLNQEIYSNDELSRQIEVLLRDKKMLMEELEETNALVVTSVRTEIQQEQLSKETWNREKRDLMTSIDSLRKENESLQESLSSLSASLRNEHEHKLNKERETNSRLREMIDGASKERDEAYHACKVLQKEIDMLRRSLDESKERGGELRHSDCSVSSSGDREKLAELIGVNDSLTKELEQKKSTLQAVQSVFEGMKEEQTNIRNTIEMLRVENAKLRGTPPPPPRSSKPKSSSSSLDSSDTSRRHKSSPSSPESSESSQYSILEARLRNIEKENNGLREALATLTTKLFDEMERTDELRVANEGLATRICKLVAFVQQNNGGRGVGAMLANTTPPGGSRRRGKSNSTC